MLTKAPRYAFLEIIENCFPCYPCSLYLRTVFFFSFFLTRVHLKFQALRSSDATVLNPGRNSITVALPPQKPGSYVLGVLTGQIGHLRFRSHSFSKGGPADSDDFMSYEKPARPILKVL